MVLVKETTPAKLNGQLHESKASRPTAGFLRIEQEMQHIAVFDGVGFAF